MATWSDILSDIRAEIEEPSASVYSDALLLTWWNEGQRDFARRTRCLQDEQYTTTIYTQVSYELPDETIDIHRATWFAEGADDPTILGPTPYESLVTQTASGDVTNYSLWNGAIYLYPAPTTAATLTILRTYAPDDIDATTDTIAFNDDEVGMVKSYVKYKAYEMTGDIDLASFHRDNYEHGVQEREWTQIRFVDTSMSRFPQEVW